MEVSQTVWSQHMPMGPPVVRLWLLFLKRLATFAIALQRIVVAVAPDCLLAGFGQYCLKCDANGHAIEIRFHGHRPKPMPTVLKKAIPNEWK